MWAAAPMFCERSASTTGPPTASRFPRVRSFSDTEMRSMATCSFTSADIASKIIRCLGS